MNSINPDIENRRFIKMTLEAAIHLGVLFVLIAWCVLIVKPFLIPVVWGIILAVAINPGYLRLNQLFNGNWPKTTAIVITVLMLVVLIIPSVLLAETVVVAARTLAARLQEGAVTLPSPPQSVKDWPVVYALWNTVSGNMESTLDTIQPQLRDMGKWLLASAAGALLSIVQFIVAIIIAGVLLAHAESGERMALAIGRRLAGERGEEFVLVAEATVRSVARGILGVALVQALLAGISFLIVGIPGAGLWALIILFLCVIQLGTLPVLLPVVIYVFNHSDPLTASIFLVWSIFLSLLDNILKPLLLGRGVEVPMLVIFIGAIGGFLSSGIIGLFVGAVILTIGYKMFLAWVNQVA